MSNHKISELALELETAAEQNYAILKELAILSNSVIWRWNRECAAAATPEMLVAINRVRACLAKVLGPLGEVY